MKLKLVIILATIATAGADEPSRTWAQAETGKTLEGTAVDKKRNGDGIQIETDGGRKLWLPTDTLTDEDKTYIEHWRPDEDKLEARVVKSSSGGRKTIEVKVYAGNIPVKVVSKISPTDPRPVIKDVPAQGQTTFNHDVSTDYVVRLYDSSKTVLDEETSKSKTGL